MIACLKENNFGNFSVITMRIKYTSEEKVFMYQKDPTLGSPALVQRVWRSKYKSSKAPSHSVVLKNC